MVDNNQIHLFESKDKCCGCGACVNACPVEAISMVEDEYGFEFPLINQEKCIKCGLCQKVCQYKNSIVKHETQNVYAASAREDIVLMSTASGGIFSTIALRYINNGGVVYGASMYDRDGNISPGHLRATTVEELEQLKGSKYVQSSIGETYSQAKKDLLTGKKVLFSGTPCQIAGLNLFLGKEYENLCTIDIICHGVPSKKFFADFIKSQEKKYNGAISKFVFRDKSKGQGQTARIQVKTKNGIQDFITNGKLLSYFGLFLKQETYRESCYKCIHTSKERNGDITLGDYWGIYIEHGSDVEKAKLSNLKGISCVLVNSQKGFDMLEAIKTDINIMDSTFEKVCRHNDQLREPSKHTHVRDDIMNAYKENGYSAIENLYNKLIGLKKIAYWIEFIMPKELKRTLKTFAHKLKRDSK